MKEKGSKKPYGQFLKYTTKNLDIYTTCSTGEKQLVENYTITVWQKTLLTKISLQNGKKLDMKIYVVCGVYKPEIPILALTVFVEYQRENWKK